MESVKLYRKKLNCIPKPVKVPLYTLITRILRPMLYFRFDVPLRGSIRDKL